LVLGDMLDLGAETRRAHEGLIPLLTRIGASRLWLVGSEMARLAPMLVRAGIEVRAFPDTDGAAAAAPLLGTPPAVVLFKGSRGMALEGVIDRLCGTVPTEPVASGRDRNALIDAE
jgi:UDP-N-acetylmuramoyl-tripeptide--D-alanyl-D-alanine ligase